MDQHEAIPFPASEAIDKTKLRASSVVGTSSSPSAEPTISHLPGDPAISLDISTISIFLSKQLETPLLDELYEHLWFVGRKRHDSIDTLSRQRVKGRKLIATDEPRLHMIFYADKIYLKPVPSCLSSHNFWLWYLKGNEGNVITTQSHHSVACGFLRSYALLVPTELDFKLAKEALLIPEAVTWDCWIKFITNFRKIADDQVGKRYHFGQLRLSRLNWAVRMFRPRCADTIWFYELPHWTVTDYVARATVPLLFLFASVSVVLSAMQVILSVPTDDLGFGRLWNGGRRDMLRSFWTFSIVVIFLSAFAWVSLLVIPVIVLLWQMQWGFRNSRASHSVQV